MPFDSDVNDFLTSTGAKPFQFENIGDSVTGVVIDANVRQATDMKGNPLAFGNGEPRHVLVITLQTDLQSDDKDDGKRSLWCKKGNFTAQKGTGSSAVTAIFDAVREAGADFDTGGTLTLTHTGLGRTTTSGFNPPKLYTAQWKPAAKPAINLDELS